MDAPPALALDSERPSTPASPASAPRGAVVVARLAWSVLAYNFAVVLWGAYVRASGSGAGCGRHWPLCNGEVVPRSPKFATLVEVTHRATSGLALVAVVTLLVVALRRLPRGHRARRAAVASTVFIITEALVGAGLVLFELVAKDASMKRAWSMMLHLGNTFFLLGALALTAWWSSVPAAPRALERSDRVPPQSRATYILRGSLVLSLFSVLTLGASGAVAALGDTLFPASSLREGLAQDLSPMAHAFVRLRVLHPVLALGTAIAVLSTAGFVRSVWKTHRVQTLSRTVTILFVVQFGAGLLNLTLLAPVGMQLVHLLLADITWIALVLMAVEAWTPIHERAI
jgi:heme A synthase